jgi:hypothetical protein
MKKLDLVVHAARRELVLMPDTYTTAHLYVALYISAHARAQGWVKLFQCLFASIATTYL